MSEEEKDRPLSGFEMSYKPPDVQSEFVERYAERGPQGAKGDKGAKGDTGEASTRLPVPQARAVIFLFALSVLFTMACFAGLLYYVHTGNQDRCTTLREIASIPASGSPGGREWESRLQAIERNRLRELGCAP